jgi:hypothetical protein
MSQIAQATRANYRSLLGDKWRRRRHITKSANEPITKSANEPKRWAPLVLACMGVDDIGTSPLYALSVAVKAASPDGHVSPHAVLGVLTLIFWSLIIVISITRRFFADQVLERNIEGPTVCGARRAPARRAGPRPAHDPSGQAAATAEAGKRLRRVGSRIMRPEKLEKVLERLATTEKTTLVVARDIGGKMRVTSGSWEGKRPYSRSSA